MSKGPRKQAAYTVKPIGFVRSSLQRLEDAPRQGDEGAPEAVVEIAPALADAIEGLAAGDEVILVTWLDRAPRDVLQVHPRGDGDRPLTGVFATRSPARPNPLGLHEVRILAVSGNELRVGPLEAVDGTPVIDIKPVLRSGTGR